MGRCGEIVGEEQYLLEQLDMILHHPTSFSFSLILFYLFPASTLVSSPLLLYSLFSLHPSSLLFISPLLPPLLSPLSSLLQEPEIIVHTTSLLPQQTTLTIPPLPPLPPPLLLRLGPTILAHSCSARRQNWHEKFESTIAKLSCQSYTYQKC